MLTCSLVEKTDAIELRNNTLIAKAYGKPEIQEGYHCNIHNFQGYITRFYEWETQLDTRIKVRAKRLALATV